MPFHIVLGPCVKYGSGSFPPNEPFASFATAASNGSFSAAPPETTGPVRTASLASISATISSRSLRRLSPGASSSFVFVFVFVFTRGTRTSACRSASSSFSIFSMASSLALMSSMSSSSGCFFAGPGCCPVFCAAAGS